jgi:hypothetical protein
METIMTSSSKTLTLVDSYSEADAKDAIEILEGLIEEIKDGTCTAVMVASMHSDLKIRTEYSTGVFTNLFAAHSASSLLASAIFDKIKDG